MVYSKVFVLSIVIFTLEIECRYGGLLISFGQDADIEDFPYQASLRKYDFHFCGATIISEKHVLTAAHCLFHHFQAPYSELTVNTGTSRRNETGHVHKVDGIIIHPDYYGNISRAINDIAIITLKEVIVFDKYQQKIDLPKQECQAGEILNLTGWGWVQENPKVVRSNQLQVLDTMVISRKSCQRKKNNSTYWQIRDTEFCTRTRVRGGVCEGDSGSSVVANGEIVGIVSWTYGSRCGNEIGSTDIHTNVYKFIDFIQQHTNMIY